MYIYIYPVCIYIIEGIVPVCIILNEMKFSREYENHMCMFIENVHFWFHNKNIKNKKNVKH